MGPHIALALLMVCSIYLAGRIAERRGTLVQNLGVDCCDYRAARASTGVLASELAWRGWRPCLDGRRD